MELWQTPDVDIHQELPLPAGNLSNFDDRWAWIENDMLPAYRELLADPGGAETMVWMPVDERAVGLPQVPGLPLSRQLTCGGQPRSRDGVHL